MTSKKDLEAAVNRYLEGNASAHEKKIVEEWYASLGSEDDAAVPPAEEAAIIERIRGRLAREIAPDTPHYRLLWPAAAAAVAIVAIVWFSASSRTENDSVTQAEGTPSRNEGERLFDKAGRLELLPDSTKVWLAEGAKLSINAGFNDRERHVSLEGEAFFDVRHDPRKPFYVHAGNISTRVLGTSFKVRAVSGEDSVMVAVKTGKVMVIPDDARAGRERDIILTPNHKVVYVKSRRATTKTLVDVPQLIASETEVSKMKFRAAPLPEVIEALETAYGVPFQYDSLAFARCKLTTTIGTDRLTERLQSICKAIGASYHEYEGTIVIEGQGCQ